ELNQGTLILTDNNQLPTTTDLTINGNATLNLNGKEQDVNSFNSQNIPGTSTPAGNTLLAGSNIAFGTDGILKITGPGDMVFRGASSATGSAATIWKANTGTLVLGQDVSTSTFAAGVTSAVLNYHKLWMT